MAKKWYWLTLMVLIFGFALVRCDLMDNAATVVAATYTATSDKGMEWTFINNSSHTVYLGSKYGVGSLDKGTRDKATLNSDVNMTNGSIEYEPKDKVSL